MPDGCAGRPPSRSASPAPHSAEGPSFLPIQPQERFERGTLLGLDAEFVAVSLPDVPLHGCAKLPWDLLHALGGDA